MISGGANNLHSTVTEYNSLRFHRGPTWNPTESTRQEFSPGTFKIISLFVKLTGSPGAGNNYKFTVRNNGSATTASLTISDSETSAKITDLNIPIVATDKLALEVVPTSTPNVVKAKWTVVLETEGDGKVFYISGQQNPLNGSIPTELNNLDSASNWSASALNSVNKEQIMSLSGTFSDFYVELGGTAGSGTDGWIFKPKKNGADSGMSVNILGSSTSGNDTVNTFSVVAGDTVHLENIVRGRTANNRNARWGIVFDCDTEEYPVLSGSSNNLHSTNTEYNYITGTDATWNATETNRRMLTSCATLSKLYVKLGQSPGAGNNYKFTIMKNGVATDLNVTVGGTDTTGNNTSDIVECDDFDELSLRSEPSSTPTTTDVTWGFAVKSIFPFPNSLTMVGHGR